MDIAIQTEGLTKRYGNIVALDSLTLAVPVGSVFGCLGPNGAGKTTLVRVLSGLTKPSAGRATVAGVDVATGGLELRRSINVLDQQPRFYAWMTGRELLDYAGRLYGLHGATLRARVDEALSVTDLVDAARRRIGGYSGGMRQRLGLAQVLLNRPDVLFLDEPASSLDPAGRHEILRAVAELRGRATVFMSTHILSDVERVCDRVAILDRGRLVVAAGVEELQARYAQPVYLIELESDTDAATLAADLRAAPWVGAVTVAGATVRVVASDAGVAAREALPLVARAGGEVVRFERARPSLEDIFLRLTGVGEQQTAEVQ